MVATGGSSCSSSPYSCYACWHHDSHFCLGFYYHNGFPPPWFLRTRTLISAVHEDVRVPPLLCPGASERDWMPEDPGGVSRNRQGDNISPGRASENSPCCIKLYYPDPWKDLECRAPNLLPYCVISGNP